MMIFSESVLKKLVAHEERVDTHMENTNSPGVVTFKLLKDESLFINDWYFSCAKNKSQSTNLNISELSYWENSEFFFQVCLCH